MANGSSRRFGSSSTVGSLKVSSSSSRKSATCCVQGCKAVARDGLVCGKHKAVANQRLDKTTEGEGTFWDEMIGLLEDEDPMSHYAGAAASSHVENPMRIPLTATSPNNGSRKVSSRRPFALEEDEAAAIAAGGAGDADGSSGYGSQQIHEVAQSLRLAMMGVQALHAQMQEHETKAQFYPKLVEENEALKHQLQLEQAKASVGGSVDDDVAERLVNLERENEEAKLVIQQLKTALEEAAARERVLKHDQGRLTAGKRKRKQLFRTDTVRQPNNQTSCVVKRLTSLTIDRSSCSPTFTLGALSRLETGEKRKRWPPTGSKRAWLLICLTPRLTFRRSLPGRARACQVQELSTAPPYSNQERWTCTVRLDQ